ncbi:MAG: serine/threonine protein kinase [Symploca sp. SIO1C2]|nr:serine/threonine protein kinase [Symploca sp. SIO1C2]
MKLLHGQGEVIAERYQIVTLLGQGGMGSTYAAVDLANNQRVAIKVVSLRGAQDWKTLELFEREAQVLATLNHPFIPKYLDYFRVDAEEDSPNSDCRFYLVQELVEGESFTTLVERGWKPKEAEVKAIARQVLEILIYLHTLVPPIIHRDIKPQNLIRREDGKVYLVDFGTVQHIVRNPQSFVSTFVGSVGYMPPEQLRGQTVFASDLYSLGATLLFLLTGKSPETLPQKMLKVDFRQVIELSDRFAQWLDRLIAPVMEDRFQSAQVALLKLKQKIDFNSPPNNPTISHSYNPSSPYNQRITLQKSNKNLVIKIDKRRDHALGLFFIFVFFAVPSFMLSFFFVAFLTQYIVSIIPGFSDFQVVFILLFMLIVPWLPSLLIANMTSKKTSLKINESIFTIKQTYLFTGTHQVQGKTEDILDISLNGYGNKCVIWEGLKSHSLFDVESSQQSSQDNRELELRDIEWLIAEIKLFLKQLQS